jgi:hypothetical protein
VISSALALAGANSDSSDILFRHTTEHAGLYGGTSSPGGDDIGLSSAALPTLGAGGFDTSRDSDALLFRDDRVGELGSWAASNGINIGSHTIDGSSMDYRTVR